MRKSSRKQVVLKRVDAFKKGQTPLKKKGLPPGRTLESVENQLVGLAIDLAREQIEKGTASSQVITHFLKLGSSTARLEIEKMQRENELLKAKTDALKSQKKTEDLYRKALSAMRSYTGSIPLSENDSGLDEIEDDSENF